MALTSFRFASNTRLRAASENSPFLQSGEKGEAVAIVQMALIDLGFPMPRSTAGGKQMPDGIFGPETQAVVKTFQSRNGLVADGIVGRKTLLLLESLVMAQSRQKAVAEARAMRFRST